MLAIPTIMAIKESARSPKILLFFALEIPYTKPLSSDSVISLRISKLIYEMNKKSTTPTPTPVANIPESTSTVDVRVIDTYVCI
jgi:hypothetical protein